MLRAAQESKASLVVQDLQNPNTILGWKPLRDRPLSRLAWPELEQLLRSQHRGMPETTSLFLARLETEKRRLHLLWRRSALIHQVTTEEALLQAIVVPLDALLNGTSCWIEISI